MNIVEIFDDVSKKMRVDFEMSRKALRPPGLKGESSEETFRIFLKGYLPQSLDISTGQLVDSHGNSSSQLDVIIYDSAKTPIFYSSSDIRVIPVECAYAVIEVKSKLDTKELRRVFQNMETVRNLKKTAYRESYFSCQVKLYGKPENIWPINYYVFAYDSIDINTLKNKINEKHESKRLPLKSRIDTVCVLDKGVICNKLANGKWDALPQPGSKLHVIKTNRALLLFYSLTSVYFNQAILPKFCFIDYLGQIEF